MLRVIQNRSAASAKSYYSHSDYLSEGQELTGFWGGRAAKLLGLSGEVDKTSFDRLCDNLHPINGQKLTLRTRSDRTVGYDFNFHCPKGVSLAYAIGQDDRILDAFRESVDETMQELEPEAKTRVRKHGVDTDRVTGNLAWAGFVHTTARPINGVPDPHLHAHYFVFNSTWDNKELAFKAGQFRDLKRDASYYEAAFHSRLAFKMRSLGYEIKRDGKSWDLAAITPALKSKFSRRTDQIEKLAEKLGITDAETKSELAAKTRQGKAKALSMNDLRVLWTKQLNENEIKLLASLATNTQSNNSLLPSIDREDESMDWAKKHCFERDSVIPEKHLRSEALRFGVGYVSVEGIKNQLTKHRVITREVEGRLFSTTPEMLAEEETMIRNARKGNGAEVPLNPDWTITRDWLNVDQQNAVQHVLKSKDHVVMVRGGAGTGKTALMREAIDGIEAGGREVLTFAPSAEASRGVLAQEGFKATTVAELLVSQEIQKQIAGNAIWIDEAGLIGTRTMKKVLDLAKATNARVILSGDWKQHGSVEAGAALRILEQQGGIKPAMVQSIQRQTGQYKEAVALLAEGKTDEGLSLLHQLGWMKEIQDDDTRFQTIAQDYANTMSKGQSVLAIAPTHAEGAKLNAEIRAVLKSRKIIDSGTEQMFGQLVPARLTGAEKLVPDSIAQTDVLVFHKNSKKHKKGDRLDAKVAGAINLAEESNCFEACKRQEIALAKGDLLRITANGKTFDGKHRLNNGSTYRIRSFTNDGNIQLENGWVVGKEYGFMAAGYVTTSHAAQGKTVDVVLLSESSASFVAADREQFYVSVSRGRHGARIYTDSSTALSEAIGKSRPRLSAIELVRDSDRRLRIKLAVATRQRTKNREQGKSVQTFQEIAHG